MSKIDVLSPTGAGELLRLYGLRPVKKLGQNFLCDRNIRDKIIRAANLTPDDPVLEIGGGMGALTEGLAAISSSVTTVEIDTGFQPLLTTRFADMPNVQFVFGDFLRLHLKELFDQAFGEVRGTVVANIPYYITTPILEHLIENKSRIRRIVLLVQREVAERMTAPAGDDAVGAFTMFAQYHCDVNIVGMVPRTVFIPPPEIESAIITLDPVMPGTVPVKDSQRLSYVVRAAFAQRRKTLLNALLRAPEPFGLGLTMEDRVKAEEILASAGIDGSRRGETLSLEEFARLSDAFP